MHLPVTLAELLYGAEKSPQPGKNRQAVDGFAARRDVLPFDDAAAAHYGDIRAVLERDGRVIGGNDTMIAGHARSRGLVIVTGNLGDFRRIDGLRSEDWLPT